MSTSDCTDCRQRQMLNSITTGMMIGGFGSTYFGLLWLIPGMVGGALFGWWMERRLRAAQQQRPADLEAGR